MLPGADFAGLDFTSSMSGEFLGVCLLLDTFLDNLAAMCARPANGQVTSTIPNSMPSELTSIVTAVCWTALTLSIEKTGDKKLTVNATLFTGRYLS